MKTKSALLDVGYVNAEINNVLNNIYLNNFRGFDPYDYYSSPLSQQIKSPKLNYFLSKIRRVIPLELDKILKIKKTLNIKSVCLTGLAILNKNKNTSKDKKILEKIKNILIKNKCKSTKYYSIGDKFPLVLSLYSSRKESPSPYLTFLAGSFFLKKYQKLNDKHCLELAKNVAEYFCNELDSENTSEGLYFFYRPNMKYKIYNVSALISSFLTRVGKITESKRFTELGTKGIKYILSKQNKEGSWFYGDKSKYIDNYHTGFILEALLQSPLYNQNTKIKKSFTKGLDYYFSSLFDDNLKPKKYVKSHPPFNINLIVKYDIRDYAQGIILLISYFKITKNPKIKMAIDTLFKNFTSTLRLRNGNYCFEKTLFWKNKNKYVRTNAWCLLTLTKLLSFMEMDKND